MVADSAGDPGIGRLRHRPRTGGHGVAEHEAGLVEGRAHRLDLDLEADLASRRTGDDRVCREHDGVVDRRAARPDHGGRVRAVLGQAPVGAGAVVVPPVENLDGALVSVAAIVVRHADHHVGEGVAVPVAGPHRAAEVGVAGGPALEPGRAGGEAGGGAVEGEGPTGVAVRSVVVGSARDQVGVAVPVEVAAGHAGPEERVRLVGRRQSDGRGAGQASRLALVDEDLPFVGVVAVRVRGPHRQVVVAVPVHVADAGDRVAGQGAVAAAGRPRDRVVQADRGAEVDVDPARFGDRVVVLGRPDGHVPEAVPVEVAGGGHGEAEVGVGLGGPGLHPGRGGLQARGRAVVGPGPPAVAVAAVVAVSADDHVGKAVAVPVTAHRHGPTKTGPRLVGRLDDPVGRRRQPGGAAVVGVGEALVVCRPVHPLGADDHVPEAVAVHVPATGHREAEVGVAGVGGVGGPGQRHARRGAVVDEDLSFLGSVAVPLRRPDDEV